MRKGKEGRKEEERQEERREEGVLKGKNGSEKFCVTCLYIKGWT